MWKNRRLTNYFLFDKNIFENSKIGDKYMMTRKEFLEEVMKRANLRDLKQADEAARAVISLTKLIIGPKLSQKIAEASPPDLREGWEMIKPAFPQRPIKIITGSGGENEDIREIIPHIRKSLGVDILVENIVGFWNKMVFEKFNTANSDGYTLISYTFPRSIIIEMMTDAQFRTSEFTPVYAWASGNQLLVVPADSYENFNEFLKDAKKRRLKCAIPLRWGITHVTGILLAKGLGIDVEWINYEGSASSIAALSRKEIDFTICLANSIMAWLKTGKIRPLVLFPDKRNPQYPFFPEVPTLKELGYEVEQITIRHVIEAPPNTPTHVVKVLGDAFGRAIKEPSYAKWANKNLVIIDPLNSEDFSKEIRETYKKIEKIRDVLKEQ